MDPVQEEISGHVDVSHIAAAGITAITLYLLGLMCRNLFGLPAPVAMLFLAVLVKLARAVSPPLQEGAFVVYKFFSTAVTYPLLFAIGVAMTPWDKLMAAFTLQRRDHRRNGGYPDGDRLRRRSYVEDVPIDTAIVNACHSGQGGTGDVAILTARPTACS